MKKLIAILLLLSLFLNILGYHIFYFLQQSKIKTEIRKSLHNGEQAGVLKFVFPLNDKKSAENIQWKGDKEFSLDGTMYDVVEKKIVGDKLILHCISDKKETELISIYEKINHEKNSKSAQALLLKLICNSYLQSPGPPLYASDHNKKWEHAFLSQTSPFWIHEVLTPPPQSIPDI